MEEAAFCLLKPVILSAIALLFSFFIMKDFFYAVEKFSTGSEKQKKRAVLCFIFFVIYLLTIYAYAVHFLLFR